MKEEKTGTAAELIFHNESNYYTILLFETEEEQFFAVGNMAYPKVGRSYRLIGEWKNHPKYGEQFAFSSSEELEPTTAEGIAAFLCSGIIKGIGPKMAAAIVRKFGADTLDVILKTPERLPEVAGIGTAKARAIEDGYREHREYADTVLALSDYDISANVCMKLYKAYGKDAVKTIKDNPYTLIGDIYGIGFKKADKIAVSVGIKNDSPHRIKSGIKYLLSQLVGSGDTYAPAAEFTENAARFLDVTREQVSDCAFEMVMDGDLCKDLIDGSAVYMLFSYYRAERYAAAKLYELCTSELSGIAVSAENLIKQEETRSNIRLSEKQKNAVEASIKNGVLVITGGPGTGKTTIINTILSIYDYAGLSTALAAPTGRAAKRMQQATGRSASTIHRLLEYAYADGEDRMIFGKNEENPLGYDCIIIDEMSMVDILLMEALLRAVSPGTRLVLVGDADQLPPVGAGNVLKDILGCETIQSCRLTDIFRQAQESAIVVNAHLINRGDHPAYNEKGQDFFMVKRSSKDIKGTIAQLCQQRLPAFFKDLDPYNDIQVLTPARKGELGCVELSRMLQDKLNPPSPSKAEKKIGERIFREGDKVMQIKNNYRTEWKNIHTMVPGIGVFNGDMGIIDTVDNENGIIGVIFDNEIYVRYDYSNIDELESAFALTVHKSQGSEFPVVVMPMAAFPPMLSTRNLLYTAITRAKEAVVLVGNPEVCNAMVDNNTAQKRYSGLGYRLRSLWNLIYE
ncbi:MAG: ATP-dependent RecD-like DNA helicase [Firmicutes bacterium]|nr:ATP-dependent RecD-like DNA helicase [Bacillota bacterium]